MVDQIFKEYVPLDIFLNFLANICNISGDSYVLTNESYKRSLLNNVLESFLDTITPYYHKSKQIYAQRKMSFARLATIARQICRIHSISYTSRITYGNSSYNIQYFIIIPNN